MSNFVRSAAVSAEVCVHVIIELPLLGNAFLQSSKLHPIMGLKNPTEVFNEVLLHGEPTTMQGRYQGDFIS